MALTKLTTKSITGDTLEAGDLAANSVDSSELVDGSIDTSHLSDDSVTLAKMASGTDGNLISYDASGNPVAIATGSDGQVLTSTGAGSPPAFESISAGFSATDITGQTAKDASLNWNDAFVIWDATTSALRKVNASTSVIMRPFFRARMTANQSISVTTWTKVAFDGESTDGDPDSNYDTGNYRWTPARNGWYQIFWSGYMQEVMDAGEFLEMQLYKNGAYVPHSAAGSGQLSTKTTSHMDNKTCVVNYTASLYLDSNDYIEVWCSHNEGASQNLQGWAGHFGGFLLQGAKSGVL